MMRRSNWRNRALAVYERDGWQCQMPVCACPGGRALDPALLRVNNPWAPTMDHIIPQVLGGTHDRENLRAAHKWCNDHATNHLKNRPARSREDSFPGDQGSRWS